MLIKILQDDSITVYASDITFSELIDKLNNSKKLEKLLLKSQRDITVNHISDYITLLKNSIDIIIHSDLTLTICRDPKDNMFLELADQIKADYIITGDNDLLELKKYNNCQIIKPSEFTTK